MQGRSPVRNHGFWEEPITTSGQPPTYTVVSPSGVRMYSFSDWRAAAAEADTLNEITRPPRLHNN
jgi:hypothetical protein